MNKKWSETLHTTTRNSEQQRAGLPFFWKNICAVAVLSAICAACSPKKPQNSFFQLSADSAKHRALQTRRIETSKQEELFSAAAAVLQDLGFQIEESAMETGILRAVKERSAREYGQEFAQVFVAVLSILGRNFTIIPVDLHQQIAATLFMSPATASSTEFNVRIVFYRKTWKGEGQSGNQAIPAGQQRMEMIYQAEIYRQFFAQLSKSVFLEIHQI